MDTYIHCIDNNLHIKQLDGVNVVNHISPLQIRLEDKGHVLPWHVLPAISGIMSAEGSLICWDRDKLQSWLIELRKVAKEEMGAIESLKPLSRATGTKWSFQVRDKAFERWLSMSEVCKNHFGKEMSMCEACESLMGTRYSGLLALQKLYHCEKLQGAIKAVKGV